MQCTATETLSETLLQLVICQADITQQQASQILPGLLFSADKQKRDSGFPVWTELVEESVT